MIEILLVEDDPALGRSLHVSLELEGYKIQWARDLKSSFEITSKQKLDLVILDLGLPDGSGFDLLKQIRSTGSRLPVLILTAQTHEDSVVEGFQLGANDYIRKPFGNRELLARIKSVLREPQKRDPQLRVGQLLLFIEQRQAKYNESEIELNRREFDILHHLSENVDRVVSRESLIHLIDKEGEMVDRTIDSHVSHLRSRLRSAGVKSIHIASVYGVGYRLEKK